MIRVALQDPPTDFEIKVGQPGANAIAVLTGQPLPHPALPGAKLLKGTRIVNGVTTAKKVDDFAYIWRRCLPDLHEAYGGICAYACFYIQPLAGPQVEHYVAKAGSGLPHAFSWKNFRLACAYINTKKNNFANVLDPAEIQDGWFQLDLSTMNVHPSPTVPDQKQNIEATILRLGLNGGRAKKMRIRAIEHFRNGRVILDYLEMEHPFLYKELQRQGIHSPADLPSLSELAALVVMDEDEAE